MNTVELIKVINNISVKGEVCAKDLLPEKKPLDMKAYIVNTDISTDPGEHFPTAQETIPITTPPVDMTRKTITITGLTKIDLKNKLSYSQKAQETITIIDPTRVILKK